LIASRHDFFPPRPKDRHLRAVAAADAGLGRFLEVESTVLVARISAPSASPVAIIVRRSLTPLAILKVVGPDPCLPAS